MYGQWQEQSRGGGGGGSFAFFVTVLSAGARVALDIDLDDCQCGHWCTCHVAENTAEKWKGLSSILARVNINMSCTSDLCLQGHVVTLAM